MWKFFCNNKKKLALGCLGLVIVVAATLGLFYFLHPQGRYLTVQGLYQLKIIFGRRSINSILKDPNESQDIKKKLSQVKEIRKFARSLGLRDTRSYTTVFDTGNKPVVWAVSACHKDCLVPYTWEFPLVGKVPYLGFFKKKDALKLVKKLKARGFDVLARPVSAYSTLGIFPDPLFSSMLRGNEEYLANTIIHEMTHETVYVKGQTNFNESLAVFVGDTGAVEYLKYKYGADSKQVKNSLAYKHDDRIFSDFMADLYDRLDAFYKSPISRENKIKGREKIFEEARLRFLKEIKPKLETNSFDYFEKLKLNNAYILFNRRYHQKVNDIEKLHRLLGSDLKKTISYLKTLKNTKTPQQKLNEILSTIENKIK